LIVGKTGDPLKGRRPAACSDFGADPERLDKGLRAAPDSACARPCIGESDGYMLMAWRVGRAACNNWIPTRERSRKNVRSGNTR
jgi:hypothetical protein